MLLCYSDRWRVKQKVPDWSWLIRICWLPLEYLRVHLQHIDPFPLPGWLGCYRLLLIFWHLLTMFHWWRIHSDSLSFSPVFSIFFSHNSVQQKVQLSRNSAATRLPLGCHSAATRVSGHRLQRLQQRLGLVGKGVGSGGFVGSLTSLTCLTRTNKQIISIIPYYNHIHT